MLFLHAVSSDSAWSDYNAKYHFFPFFISIKFKQLHMYGVIYAMMDFSTVLNIIRLVMDLHKPLYSFYRSKSIWML